jgi:tRNA nucleotidyltransferase (CCA-adding enzyme)
VSAVGGVVRDALLGRDHRRDLDLVVEGDAIAVARRVARALGVRVVEHGRFGTAVLELPHGDGHVDFITARTERYPRPGALPEVAAGSLHDDLARRDFTVNAMALRLCGPSAGELVDPHGGRDDLRAGLVRAMRDDAFVEDPSRIVRAARYAGRLTFALEPRTAEAAGAAAPTLDWGSSRVAEELRRLMEEDDPAPALAVLAGLGVPGVAPDAPARVAALDAAARRPGAPEVPGWALRLGGALDAAALGRLHVPGWAGALGREAAAGPALARRLAAAGAPSEVDGLLRRTRPATAVGALAAGAEAVEAWWRHGRDLRLAVDGSDLVRAGVAPGPAVGRALAAVRSAVLDGRVDGRDAQLALALAVARDAP